MMLSAAIALLVIIGATRLCGMLARQIGQPPVIGELVAGILLGPSLLGHVAPAVSAALFPAAVLPIIAKVAEVGVVVFMFRVGVELDVAAAVRGARTVMLIAYACNVVPFVMGFALALWLHATYAGAGVSVPVFALFVGIAMSITAFPVLARILTDYQLHKTTLGVIALSAAAVGDATAWCLLAVVSGIVRAQQHEGLVTIALTVVFVAGMATLARPLVSRLAARRTPASIALLVAGLAASALAADAIGIHAIFGAFLFGAIVPSHSPAAGVMTSLFRGLVSLLLPAFFAVTGLRTEVALISGGSAWLTLAAVLGVACAGKFGAGYVAARVVALPGREALAIGALMNTRGLVELVVLNIGLSLGVISPALFAMLVLMALVTTAATSPVLYALGWRPAEKTSGVISAQKRSGK